MSYEERVSFTLSRGEEGFIEDITVSFDSSNSDIHDVLKRFANFLISMSYSPEAIQKGFDDFDIEAL